MPDRSGTPSLEATATPWRRRLAHLLEFRPRETAALGVLCAAVVAAAAFAYARSLPRSEPAALASPLPAPSVEASPGSPATLIVHVAGAVRRPGVYALRPGARVIDAVRAAGGGAPGADLGSINLARPLADGERVYVPRRGETPGPEASGVGGVVSGGGSSSGSASEKLNLNTATAAQFEALPGIGPVLAQRIVDYRTQHGPFRSVRDLLKVEGIGEKKFAAIKDHVTV